VFFSIVFPAYGLFLNPDSPDTLPATQKQNLRQIRRRNSVGDLRDLDTIKKLCAAQLYVILCNVTV
jgi:hypothetical protein